METINAAIDSVTSTFQATYDVARQGFGQGTNEHYDRARPSYPAASLQRIHSELSSSAKSRSDGLNILELGSGTGLFSRLLLSPPDSSYPQWNIHSLYAVEPSEGMRAEWTRKHESLVKEGRIDLKQVQGEVQTIPGGFQDLSVLKLRLRERGEGVEWADLVVIAQAWHWAHPNYDASIREISSLMKPDGLLIFIWNNENRELPYSQELRAFEESLENDTPQQRRKLWTATFDTPAYKDNFKEETGERDIVPWKSHHDQQKAIDRILSKSYVASRPDAEKQVIITKIKDILSNWYGQEWIDKEAGTYYQDWSTEVVIMHRK